jgi:hypothetical protein
MCIYCNTPKYRKIYENHFGKIPTDEYGRTYDIHHIDGNRQNNIPENLIALSLVDHMEAHKLRGDYGACRRLAQRLKISKEGKSHYARLAMLAKIADGTHNWAGDKHPTRRRIEDGSLQKAARESALKRLASGTHNFQNPAHHEKMSVIMLQMVENNTHYWLTDRHKEEVAVRSSKRMRKLAENNTHPGQSIKICPHCGISKRGPSIYKTHFDRCIHKPN